MSGRAWTSPVSWLWLGLWFQAIASAETLGVGTGVTVEEFSFAGSGHTEWAQVKVIRSPSASFLVRGEAVHRFDQTATQGIVAGGRRLSTRTGLEGEMSVSPGAAVVPRFSTSWFLYRVVGSVQLIPSYRFAHFDLADLHLLSMGTTWPLVRSIEGTVRVFAAATQFRSGLTEWNPGLLVQALLPLGEEVSLAPAYAFRRESFEAGTPTRAERFEAHVARVEASYNTPRGFLVKTAGEYEARSLYQQVVRRYELGLQYTW